MDWLKSLGELTPTALYVVALFVIAKYVIAPLLQTHKDATEVLAKAHKESAERFSEALGENTKAVKESIDHNERIISNHLSKEAERDAIILSEMRNVADAVERMNNRRRDIDCEDESV